jgi:hypothetical protein
MPGCGHRRLVILYSLQCSRCQSDFNICAHCYRGHRYCGPQCRDRARRQQLRDANARHQRSDPGRLDHNHHQRAYRERLRVRHDRATGPVTYLSSPGGDSDSSCGYELSSRLLSVPTPATPRPAGTQRPVPLWRCCLCRRPGIPIRWALYVCLWYATRRCRPTNAP